MRILCLLIMRVLTGDRICEHHVDEHLLHHDDGMKRKHFPYYWKFFLGESTGDQWIRLTKGQQGGVLMILCCLPEKDVEQTVKLMVIYICLDAHTYDVTVIMYTDLLQRDHIDGLVQDCTNSSALAMDLLQSCTNPSTLCYWIWISA